MERARKYGRVKRSEEKQQARKPAAARIKINNTEIDQQQETQEEKLERRIQELVDKHIRATRYNSNAMKSNRRDSTW